MALPVPTKPSVRRYWWPSVNFIDRNKNNNSPPLRKTVTNGLSRGVNLQKVHALLAA